MSRAHSLFGFQRAVISHCGRSPSSGLKMTPDRWSVELDCGTSAQPNPVATRAMVDCSVFTMHNDVGERLISISFEGTDFEELITAGVIILVSWIMEEGRKLRETDELTV